MKRGLISAILLVGVSSCATFIAPNNEQTCATQGMYLDSIGYGSANVASFGQASHSIYANSQNVQCVRPRTKREECEVDVHQHAAAIEWQEYDHSCCLGKNAALLVGYSALLLPGAGLYYWFYTEKNDAIEKAMQYEAQELPKCKALGEPAH